MKITKTKMKALGLTLDHANAPSLKLSNGGSQGAPNVNGVNDLPRRFASMTPTDHQAMKNRLLRLAANGAPKPKTGTREGYALEQYTQRTGEEAS
jgi:hypothetical protein